MNLRETRALLRNAMERRLLIEVEVPSSPGEGIAGVPVDLNKEWVLIAVVRDFDSDGYVALQLRAIASLRKIGMRKGYGRLVAREGIATACVAPSGIDLDGPAAMLRSLKKAGRLAAVHFADGDDSFLWIGEIAGARSNRIQFRFLDPDAQWDAELRRFDEDEEVHIEFGSRYLSVYERHMTPYRKKAAA